MTVDQVLRPRSGRPRSAPSVRQAAAQRAIAKAEELTVDLRVTDERGHNPLAPALRSPHRRPDAGAGTAMPVRRAWA